MLMIVCIKCLQLGEQELMRCIFTTGFRKIGGINYQLGICKNCPGDCNAERDKVTEKRESTL